MGTFRPRPLLLVLLLQAGTSLADVPNDFSAYPQDSQTCLTDSADQAGCVSGVTGADLNNCLCKNTNNFVYNVASCVAENDPNDLASVYDTMESRCAGTGTTLTVPKSAFLAQASAATSSSTPSATPPPSSSPSPSSTPTQIPTPSPSPSSDDSGLTTAAKIGIGVGIGFGAIAIGLAVWFIILYQRRRRSTQSVHSHDNLEGGSGSGGAAGAFGRKSNTASPRNDYAHDNVQDGAAELAPYGFHERKGSDPRSGVPLLAELGNTTAQPPVELPASEGYLGYSDRTTHQHARQPSHEAVSPTTSSVGPAHEGRTMSPISSTHYSNGGGTY